MQTGRHVTLFYGVSVLLSCFINGGLSLITGIRLVGGGSPVEGRVEVKYQGIWGTVCDDYFSHNAAKVVCRSLGLPIVDATAMSMAFYGKGTGRITLDDVRCTGSETSLNNCPHGSILAHNCGHHEDVGVICGALACRFDAIRLVGGTSPMEGRVEVKYQAVWGTVCDDSFNDNAATVVCKSLGFPSTAAVARHRAAFGRGTGRITMDDVRCLGSENSLNECPHKEFLAHNCGHNEDVGVQCLGIRRTTASPTTLAPLDPSTVFVRLVGGSTANQGRVEVFYRNEFGMVCDDAWGVNDAKVICSMLGYQRSGSAVGTPRAYGLGTGQIWIDQVNCHGTERSVALCPTTNGWGTHDCRHLEDAGVICSQNSSLDNFLLVTDTRNRHIYRMDLSTFSYTEIPHDSHVNPIAVGYDHIDQKLYWSDVQSKKIKASNLDGSDAVIVVNLPSNAVPDGIAVDPISRNLFFTDTGTDKITVVKLDGFARKDIITSGLDEPRAIAVHPSRGYIFWTDWGRIAKIERANMDGSGRSVIINSDLEWPNGLAIDYSANLLYWADAGNDFIQKADFFGHGRVTIRNEAGHLFGLAVVHNHIYYTDWHERNIIRMDKTGTLRTIVGPPTFGRLNALSAYKAGDGIYALPANGCTIANGNCKNICVPMPNNANRCI